MYCRYKIYLQDKVFETYSIPPPSVNDSSSPSWRFRGIVHVQTSIIPVIEPFGYKNLFSHKIPLWTTQFHMNTLTAKFIISYLDKGNNNYNKKKFGQIDCVSSVFVWYAWFENRCPIALKGWNLRW